MKITIITVCYNSIATIRRTFDSVLAQTYDDVEYIVVDGASTDGTLDVIHEYEPAIAEKGYVFRFVSEPDKGMYDAMNKGIGMARGELIGILNSDDWYEPEALTIVAQACDRVPGAESYRGAIRIHNGGRIMIKHARDRRYRTSRDFNHPAMFVRKSCYDTIGNYGITNVHDDYGWFLKAVKEGAEVLIIEEILTNYPTGGAGSVKSFRNTLKRIGTKYKVYCDNGYSRLYYLECVMQELVKYVFLRKN